MRFMPIYEYRCSNCLKKVSIWWPSIAAVHEAGARCEKCGSPKLTRVMSKVRVLRHGSKDSSGSESDTDGDNGMDEGLLKEMEGLDENDPRSLGRFMRKMAAQTGESLGEEFEEVVGRLEKGEDPEAIEQKMGDVLAGPEGMGGEMDDPYGMPPAAPADDPEPKSDPKKAGASRTGRGMAKKDGKAGSAKARPTKSVSKGGSGSKKK